MTEPRTETCAYCGSEIMPDLMSPKQYERHYDGVCMERDREEDGLDRDDRREFQESVMFADERE